MELFFPLIFRSLELMLFVMIVHWKALVWVFTVNNIYIYAKCFQMDISMLNASKWMFRMYVRVCFVRKLFWWVAKSM